MNSNSAVLAWNFRRLLGNVNNPSPRTEFYERIVSSAREIAVSCVADLSFRQIFDNQDENIQNKLEESNFDSMRQFRAAVDTMQDAVKPWRQEFENENDPLFTLVFDGVDSLMNDAGNERFIALNRIISTLSTDDNIWFLFLSTDSRLDTQLLSPGCALPGSKFNEQSARSEGPLGSPLLKHYPPFTSFTVDVDDLKNHYQANPDEETMSDFSKVKHMARFGRPLWSAYDRPEHVARLKLIGSSKGAQYNPKDRDHVFAALSFRLGLDVNLTSPIAYPLSHSAVHLHMRVVTKVIPSTGLLYTRTPAEPILALAAKEHLASTWRPSLQTFVSELLSPGAIDKGRNGELYARLMCILARDSIPKPQLLDQEDDGAVPSLTVASFLRALFAKPYHGAIKSIDSTILSARMDFLMFTSTIRDLPSESFYHVCHALLRRSAALQCAPGQKSYDTLLPFYWGPPDGPYDLAKAGAILVQVKNGTTKTSTQELIREAFLAAASVTSEGCTRTTSGSLPNSRPKLLYILLDLGVCGRKLEVHPGPNIWTIHCVGHSKDEDTN